MGHFPQDFSELLISIAILEALAGVLKSKFKSKVVFWIGFYIEMVCAAIQTAALILQAERGGTYSRIEMAAVYITIVADLVFLLVEGAIVWILVDHHDVKKVNTLRSLLIASILSIIVGLFAMPILLAKFQRLPLKRFKSKLPAALMLALSFSTPVLFILAVMYWVCMDAKDECFYVLLGVGILNIPTLSLALGIVILTASENLSVSFLIVSNIYPAVITLVSAIGMRDLSF